MLKHALLEGFKNMVRSFWISATAVSVLTVSLGSVALIASFSTIIGFSVRQLDNQIAIVAYFNEDIDPNIISQVESDLSSVEEIKEIRYIDREEAQKRLQESNSVADQLIRSLQESDIEVVLEYLEIVPNSSEEYAVVEQILRSDQYQQYFSDIDTIQDVIEQLQRLYFWTRVIGLALVVIFGLVSILVMVNILRIAIYSFKDEIEVMRLVGATNNYIRAPFIMEGFYFNLIAAFLVLIVFVPSLNSFLPNIQEFIGTNSDALLLEIYTSLSLTIILGMVFGVITTYIAIRRYLEL